MGTEGAGPGSPTGWATPPAFGGGNLSQFHAHGEGDAPKTGRKKEFLAQESQLHISEGSKNTSKIKKTVVLAVGITTAINNIRKRRRISCIQDHR